MILKNRVPSTEIVNKESQHPMDKAEHQLDINKWSLVSISNSYSEARKPSSKKKPHPI
jgi:hypothetical protein